MSNNRSVLIIGAGGHGSELLSYISDLKRGSELIEFLGFVDDNKEPGLWNGARILGGVPTLIELLKSPNVENVSFITAVGDNGTRRLLVERLQTSVPELTPWILQHPGAVVGNEVEIGPGTCLAPGSVVTTNAQIGAHCILNVNVSVSHDSIVGDFVNLNPGVVVAGNVQVGTGAFIGAGATLIDRVKVGEWAVIGAGAVVIKDVPPNSTAVGVPARVIKHHD
jgi:sugar O-acyltransferase (sialic acid O-acetyltransferase NeuD family)